MTPERKKELMRRYCASNLEQAEKIASGYAWTLDESQPIDDSTLSDDIDEMRAELSGRHS